MTTRWCPAPDTPKLYECSPLEGAITDLILEELRSHPEIRDALLAKVQKAIREDEFERNWRDNL